jgi:DNA-directed RNA polymerase subunit RPC12/RpoP
MPATATKSLSYTCRECGTFVEASVTGPDHGREFVITNHPSSFVCPHYQDVHMALSDLDAGIDPERRCPECGSNPCEQGVIPLSCL